MRLLGEVSSHDGSPQQAEGYYNEAIAAARELDLHPLVAHCHHGLGKLHLHSGQPDQARAQLATAATMYREMDMRFWLEQAEAELNRVSHLAQMSED